jgi:hypothetical protein
MNGLFPQIIYIDLVGKDEEQMREAVITGVQLERKKPKTPPPFPGIIPVANQQVEVVSKNWHEEWLNNRIKELENNQFANDILEGPKLVLHLIPLVSMRSDHEFPIKSLQ